MELFDLTKTIFSNDNNWKDVSNSDKKKHSFMMNRFAAIAYPMQANVLQHVRCNPIDVMDFWHDFMSVRHKSVPYWMYNKGKKQKESIKEKKMNITKNTMIEYARLYKLSLKDINSFISLYGDEAIKELKEIEKGNK